MEEIAIKKRIIMILCMGLVLTSGCKFESRPDNPDWAQWYESVSYSEYMSEEYPYMRSLIRLEGTVIHPEKDMTTVNGTSVTGCKFTLQTDNGDQWQCAYYTVPSNTTFLRNPVLPVIKEFLKEDEHVIVYGHHDKRVDMDAEGNPIVSVVRLSYQDQLYQGIGQNGDFSLTLHEPSYSSSEISPPPFPPLDFTAEEFVDAYNHLAGKYDAACIDKASIVTMNYSKGVRTYWPVDSEKYASFTAGMQTEQNTDTVLYLEMSYSSGYAPWRELQPRKKEVAREGLALAVMAVNPQMTFEEAKEVVEQTQTKKGKSGRHPVRINDYVLNGLQLKPIMEFSFVEKWKEVEQAFFSRVRTRLLL